MATLVYVKPALRVAWELDLPLKTPDGLRQQHMWNILRGPNGRGGIGPADLALLSSVEGLEVSEEQARRYLAALEGRKVVRELRPDQWSLRPGLMNRREPALKMQLNVLYVPSWSLPDGRSELVEAPL